LNGTANVEVDHLELALEIGLGKGAAKADTGIDRENVDRAGRGSPDAG
jgi:hypothetical protein